MTIRATPDSKQRVKKNVLCKRRAHPCVAAGQGGWACGRGNGMADQPLPICDTSGKEVQAGDAACAFACRYSAPAAGRPRSVPFGTQPRPPAFLRLGTAGPAKGSEG